MMRSPKLFFLLLSIFPMVGCSASEPFTLRSTESSRSDVSVPNVPKDVPAEGLTAATNQKDLDLQQNQAIQQISLNQASQSQSMAEAMNRKIIRDADLTLEVSLPAEVQRKITSIAETVGGFVVTSESKQRQIGDAKEELTVNLVVRVPSTQFGSALDQIRSAGSRVIQEKISGNDVTEEFIDLEARIKTQKALESQFLEIMKQAHKVVDALEVQRQIAEVRTEIEKLEGRKRFLENRSSLSTITVNLQTATAITVTTSGFGRNIREAVADSVDVASAIVLFLIRFVIVMIPIFLLVILPGLLLTRYFLHRARKMQRARTLEPDIVSTTQPE